MRQVRQVASGMWQGAGGIRRSCMRQQFVCCCLEADTTKERDRKERERARGRERGRSERVIDKTGAELDTPGREASSTLGLVKRGKQGVHALSLRRDYVKKFVLTNDVADILCRVHCPLTNSPPHSPLCCVRVAVGVFPSHSLPLLCWRNARVSLAPVCLHMCATDAA